MIKLLFVEDDPDMSFLVEQVLTNDVGGYEVKTAKNGKEGLRLLSAETPDIIVTDIDMPVMNGIEMVKKIRLTNKHIPILFLTGKAGSDEIDLSYAAGGSMYIKKPVKPKELNAHIKGVLNSQHDQHDQLGNENKTAYRIGKYTFDAKRYCLEHNGQTQNISKTDAQMLALLCENRGSVLDKHDVVTKFWGDNVAYRFTSRRLDVVLCRLRRYLSQDTSISIKTIRGVGVMLTDAKNKGPAPASPSKKK